MSWLGDINKHIYDKGVASHVQLVWARTKRLAYLSLSLGIIFGPLAFMGRTVNAAQLTSRSLTISSAVPAASGVTYTFNFTPATATAITSMTMQFCTSAIGTCTAPAGSLNVKTLGAGHIALTNFEGTVSGLAQDTTTTTPVDCTQVNDLCATWTDATAQTATNHTITLTDITNPNLGTFYVRIVTYSGTYTTVVDSGNVAAATTQTFTVNATVQEQLTFCVGAVNGTSATVEVVTYALPTCSSLSGSSLSLGTLSSSAVSVSPVSTAQPYNGDLNNAVAELTTNAANGSVISYNAVQQSGTNHLGALRVAGATCATGNSFTDQCINSVGATSAILAPGTEDFGMTIPGVNCYNVPSSVYTCNQTTHNLAISSNYNCNSTDAASSFDSSYFDTGGQTTSDTLCKYAWDETGTSETVATSSSVVAGEGLIMEFAATPELTTPTGAYAAQANFVATPTF